MNIQVNLLGKKIGNLKAHWQALLTLSNESTKQVKHVHTKK